MSNWINIKDELPKEDQRILIWDKDDVGFAMFINGKIKNYVYELPNEN